MPNKSAVSIVDDDPSVLEGMKDLLNSKGFAAQTFQRAEEFLKSDHFHNTFCLVTDMQMPGMTGLELYNRLIASGKIIPTILITAYPDDKARTLALRSGVLCYLIKPFDENELLACIRSALKHRKTEAGGEGHEYS